MSDCQNCAALQTELTRLQAENKRLAEWVKKLTQALNHVALAENPG